MPEPQDTDIDARLASLGIHRIPVPVPFVDAGGPVNVYVLEEPDGFSLFDTGVGTDAGRAAVEAGLDRLGLRTAGLRRIFVSHGHVDHYGMAERLAAASGAPVFVHTEDQDKVAAPNRWSELRPVYRDYLALLGMPEEELKHVEALRAMSEQMGERVAPARLRPLRAGQRLAFRHFGAEVLHLPGHTPGLVCLYVENERLLLADDHVLARISPNPLLDLSRGVEHKFRALAAYLVSARRVLTLDVDWVLPGHGAPFQDHRKVLEGLFAFYERRQEKIRAALAEKPSTAYDLIPIVFGKLDLARLFLTLSEVVGNLEVLEDAGAVVRERVGDAYQYRATGAGVASPHPNA